MATSSSLSNPRNPNPSEKFEIRIVGNHEALESLTEERNWAGLPRDVLVSVFQRVGLIGVLSGAELVCSAWRNAAKEETDLWRRISIGRDYEYSVDEHMAMVRLAVDRSKGRLEEFCISDFCDNGLLQYVTERASNLKSLRLISCEELSAKGVAEAVKGLKQLEELEIRRCPLKRKVVDEVNYNRQLGKLEVSFSSLNTEAVEVIGQECPHLTRFKLKHGFSSRYNIGRTDEEAIAIAKTMHELRYLQLFGNRITNEGLEAIIRGCPLLETLDLRECRNVKMNAEMWALCSGVKTLVLPGDRQEQESEFVTDTACQEDHSDSDDDRGKYYGDELYEYEQDGFWKDAGGHIYDSNGNLFSYSDPSLNKWIDGPWGSYWDD